MLDRRGAELVADAREHRVAILTGVARNADLDQFVRGEVDVDFVQDGGREPVLADADDGMKVMRLGAKRAPLAG